ncbi:MAG: hypothetical protein AB8C02_11365 [Halioglobus sp.]
MPKLIASVVGKLILSLVAVYAFILIGSSLPFFHSTPTGYEITTPSSTLASPTNLGMVPQSTLSIAGLDNRLVGQILSPDGGSGFSMEEVDIDGPCKNAGERHLELTCHACTVTEGVPGDDGSKNLLWMRENGEVGMIYRDCTETLANGQVRIPTVIMSSDSLNMAQAQELDTAKAIPALPGSSRDSAMTMGMWVIAIDSLRTNKNALHDMGMLLAIDGWELVPQEKQSNQRVYSRNPDLLCVVTLNQTDHGHQLVTMMTIL